MVDDSSLSTQPPSRAPAPLAKADRWAHRRTEPRPLAFLWTTFLAVASAITLVTLVAQGALGHDVYRPAARALFAIVGTGLAVLWPMLRLSQATAPGSLSVAVVQDASVLIAPSQAVLWPQAMFFLADWPLAVIGACAAVLAAWTLLIGAVLAVALMHVRHDERHGPARSSAGLRAAWMAAIIAMVGLGPAIGLAAGWDNPTATRTTDSDTNLFMLASPVTAVLEITADRPWSGKSAVALPAHWRAVWGACAAALIAWALVIPARRRFLAPNAPSPSGPDDPIGIQTQEQEPLHEAGNSVPGSGSAEAGGNTPPHGSTPMEMVTKADRESIEKRLAELVANRPVISQRIAEARAHGDLRENGDYHAAREQQGMDEADIRRLEQRLANMTVIDESMAKAVEGLVVVGTMVRLRDVDNNDTDLFKLVGEAASPPPMDYVEVTTNSPMGEALLKSRVGDTIRVNAPRGVKKFLIVEIL